MSQLKCEAQISPFFSFFLSHICNRNYFGLFKLILFCAIPSNVCVGDVVMPNRQNNPLLWEDHCLGFTCGCGDVLEMESFNLKHAPSRTGEITLIVGI